MFRGHLRSTAWTLCIVLGVPADSYADPPRPRSLAGHISEAIRLGTPCRFFINFERVSELTLWAAASPSNLLAFSSESAATIIPHPEGRPDDYMINYESSDEEEDGLTQCDIVYNWYGFWGSRVKGLVVYNPSGR